MPNDDVLHPSPNTSHEHASRGRLQAAVAWLGARLRDQAGFTIIETAVAAVILVIGLLTTFLALDMTVRTSQVTRARESAINLAREITEDARALQYSSLTSSSAVTTALQAMPGLASTSSGSTWTISRRGFTYTVSVAESDLPAVSLTTIAQKQIAVSVSWKVQNIPRTYTQTSTISSGGQGVNMAATALMWSPTSNCSSPCTATAPIITASMNVNTMTFSVQTPNGMSGVAWEVNGVSQSWTANPSPTNATTTTWTTTTQWNIASLPDGTYEVGAAAQNGSSTGTYTRIFVRLARGIPSAPSFSTDSWAGAGFDPNFYTNYGAGTKSTVAELDWSGSNNPNVTSNGADYSVVGYQVTNPSGTVICKTAVTSQSGLTSAFPGSCGINGAAVWCQSPTACTDENPASTSGTQTYSVAALYYNSSNVLSAGPAASIALSGMSAQTYTLAPTTQNTSTNCPSGSPQNDLRTTYTAGTTDTTTSSTATSGTAVFCSKTFGQTTNITTGGSATLYFTNTSTKACTVSGTLSLDGVLGLPSVSVTVPKAVSTPTAYTFTWTGGGAWQTTSNDRLVTTFSWSSCGAPTQLHYGSTAYPSTFSTNTFPIQTPNAPTNLTVSSVTTNPDGTTKATLTWTAPTTGPPVNAYRIYRDGQNYSNRVYYNAASDPPFCSAGTCTWTDDGRTTTHTYAVTAVGTTTTGSSMAESSFAGPTSAQ